MALQRSASVSKVAMIVLPSVFFWLLFRLAPQRSASKTKSKVAMRMSKACCTGVQPSMSMSLFRYDFTVIIRINLLVLEGGGGVPVSV